MNPQELKNSILQLAIQGKLVEQRPEEGTAEELFAQIQAQKRQLIKEGKIKKEKPLPEIKEEEIPFEIPAGWKWVRLGEIGSTNIGLTYSPQNQTSNGTIVLRSSNIHNGKMAYDDIVRVTMSIPRNKICQKGDILICARNGSKRLVGKSAVIDNEGMSFGAFMAIFRSNCNLYVLHVIESAFFRNCMLGDSGTTTINQITQDMLKNAAIPLPPLAEQHRIVAKIEELQPYIDRYEQAWSKLETLNKRFPTDMQKSILQMAIQGKLVEQRPEEGTAEELFAQIQAQKQQLIKEGKIKKEKTLPEITEDEIPFDIPEGWIWARLSDFCEIVTGNTPFKQNKSYYGKDYPLYKPTDLDAGYDVATAGDMLSERGYEVSRKLPANTVLVTCIGATIGKTGLIRSEGSSNQQINAIIPYVEIMPEYIYFLCTSDFFQNQIHTNASATTLPIINKRTFEKLLFVIPPLAEQQRIVAKLEEILPLCAKLKRAE